MMFSGGVECLGRNNIGQLGDGTFTDRSTPTAVSGLSSGVATIAAGEGYTCAVLSTGSVQCWGDNRLGQLGDGTNTHRNTPTAVNGFSDGVASIAAGCFHTCALLTSGGVECWGYNSNGQLGDGTATDHNTPTAVSGLSSGVIALALGDSHSCALLSTGGVVCWGYNSNGQLGDGTATDHNTPTAVSGVSNGVIALAAGGSRSCALLSTGGVVCWGYNGDGQLGDGTDTQRNTPTAVSGISSGVIALAAGRCHTCALYTAGGIQCWGCNNAGQLGDGTTTVRTTPTAVLLPL